jgi:hypothetical protein
VFSRKAIFVTAALEAALAVAVGLGILLVPFTILWLTENNASVDFMAAYRAAADTWLAAHGVHIIVPAQKIAGIAAPDFVLSIIPLGLGAIVFGTAYRVGRRLAATQQLWPGWAGAFAVYLGFSLLITTTAKSDLAFPVVAQGTYQPAVLWTLVTMASSLFARPIDLGVAHLPEAPERILVRARLFKFVDGLGWWYRAVSTPAYRAGTAVVASLLGFSGLVIALSLAFNWIEVIRLYEGMQLTLLGGILLTVGQIALLPNFVVLGADWFTGVGFSIGTGSLVSPLGSQLGPMPAFPIFAALPAGTLSFGMIAIAVPVVAAFLATLRVREHAEAMRFEFASAFNAALSLGLGIGVVAGLEMVVLNLVAGGAIGPGRFADFGGNPWLTGLVVFLETAVVSTLAAFYSAKPEAPDAHLIDRVRQPLRKPEQPAEPAASEDLFIAEE